MSDKADFGKIHELSISVEKALLEIDLEIGKAILNKTDESTSVIHYGLTYLKNLGVKYSNYSDERIMEIVMKNFNKEK